MRVLLAAVGVGIAVVIGVGAQGPTPQPATPPVAPAPTAPAPAQAPCVRVNQDADGHCSGYGVIPYPPGDPRLGVPVNPTPTSVPQAPFAGPSLYT